MAGVGERLLFESQTLPGRIGCLAQLAWVSDPLEVAVQNEIGVGMAA